MDMVNGLRQTLPHKFPGQRDGIFHLFRGGQIPEKALRKIFLIVGRIAAHTHIPGSLQLLLHEGDVNVY